jgi:hypothetical protein
MKKTLLLFAVLLAWAMPVLAGEVTLKLIFPKEPGSKVTSPGVHAPQAEVAGNCVLNITPYPLEVKDGSYSVEYYLEGTLLYTTSGFNKAAPDKLDFSYVLDTRKFENGIYRAIANYYDDHGRSAIGIQEIRIKNEESK